jgi:hypothetical protein
MPMRSKRRSQVYFELRLINPNLSIDPMLRFHSVFSALALFTALAMPVQAGDIVFKSSRADATLLELYSSEGCSSCPPAEAWVSELKKSPGLFTEIFPVVFHVDYWDGLGWRDKFAKAVYTRRQRNYAAALSQDSVYTPEFVTGGREWKAWFDGDRQPHSTTPTTGELSLQVSQDGRQVVGSYSPGSQATGLSSYTLNVALLGTNIRSNVRGGENGGRRLLHDFVVLDFTSVPFPNDRSFQSDQVNLKSSTDDRPGALVAWVSSSSGKVVQVAGGYLPSSAPAVP